MLTRLIRWSPVGAGPVNCRVDSLYSYVGIMFHFPLNIFDRINYELQWLLDVLLKRCKRVLEPSYWVHKTHTFDEN